LDIFAILIGLVILAATAFYVSRPLRQSQPAAKPGGADALSLEAQRESLYTQIKELDLDHATGKVNEKDYARLRADLVAQAAEVLRQIDGVAQPAAPAATIASAATPAAEDDLEAVIAARRKGRSTAAPRTIDADVEASIAARRKTAASPAGDSLCPQCGRPINVDDAFCAKCGAALRTQATP
jgi:hypothetical protein